MEVDNIDQHQQNLSQRSSNENANHIASNSYTKCGINQNPQQIKPKIINKQFTFCCCNSQPGGESSQAQKQFMQNNLTFAKLSLEELALLKNIQTQLQSMKIDENLGNNQSNETILASLDTEKQKAQEKYNNADLTVINESLLSQIDDVIKSVNEFQNQEQNQQNMLQKPHFNSIYNPHQIIDETQLLEKKQGFKQHRDNMFYKLAHQKYYINSKYIDMSEEFKDDAYFFEQKFNQKNLKIINEKELEQNDVRIHLNNNYQNSSMQKMRVTEDIKINLQSESHQFISEKDLQQFNSPSEQDFEIPLEVDFKDVIQMTNIEIFLDDRKFNWMSSNNTTHSKRIVQ